MDPSWVAFVVEIEAARTSLKLGDREECFFRGHANNAWLLIPTLQRCCAANGIKKKSAVQQLEADLFFEFQARAAQLEHRSTDDWDLLFTMRHHGVATRLLDWTEVFAVALYFAVRNATAADSPHIWLLNALPTERGELGRA